MKKIFSAIFIILFGLIFIRRAVAAPVLKPKPTPSPTPTLSLAKKPTPTPTTVVWKGNGTNGGYCEDNSYDPTVDQGKQRWLFVLTSPYQSAGSWQLTTDFDPDQTTNTFNGIKRANGAVHFIVFTTIGAKLESAQATNGTANSVLTVSHCEYNVEPLTVSKTAETSYTRNWSWRIEKTGDAEDLGSMKIDETKTVNYTATVSASYVDSDYLVEGKITITNPSGNVIDATITGIEDYLDSSGSVDVDCGEGIEFPYTLPAGDSLECSYRQGVTGMDDTKNTAKVTTEGLIKGNTAEASVVWSSDPTIENDECVTVSDTSGKGPQGEKVCAEDLEPNSPKIFTYSLSFGPSGADVPLVCYENQYKNIVSFITNDNKTTDKASWVVTAYLKCPVNMCSYSQGYWFAKPDSIWPGDITIGGHTYTESEGRAIFKSSNAGGITAAKKGFLQLATIKLSLYGQSLPSELQGYADTIENFLTGKPKLTGNNITEESKAVRDAADAISQWINDNPCK